jgi:hypothetical protein
MGAFRVLIAGSRHFTDYPALRAALDILLKNRLHDATILTCGCRGVPMARGRARPVKDITLVD